MYDGWVGDFPERNYTEERENLFFVKRKLLENISFFSKSNLCIDSNLDLFRKALILKLQEDLSNLSKEDCSLKETAKLILEYNKMVNEFMLPINNLEYVILPFFPTKE